MLTIESHLYVGGWGLYLATEATGWKERKGGVPRLIQAAHETDHFYF